MGSVHEDSNLTKLQEKFIYEYLYGDKTLTEAYLTAYPNRKSAKRNTAMNAASLLFSTPKVQRRYKELLDEFREREKTKIGWTREQAIETLKFVIDTNVKDLQRIEQAAEEELQYLKSLAENETDTTKLAKVIGEMLTKRKRTRANKTNNDGIINATSELNKMHGYNEQTINLNGSVVFEGEEQLQ